MNRFSGHSGEDCSLDADHGGSSMMCQEFRINSLGNREQRKALKDVKKWVLVEVKFVRV